jgi:hypothetical protein
MPDPVRKKNKDGSVKSDVWWLRKKVPARNRRLVGHGEVWRSLETTDRKTAVLRCNKLSADLDKDWADRLRAAEAAGRTSALPAPTITDWDLSGLQPLAHAQGREMQIRNPPAGSRWGLATGGRSEQDELDEREYDEADMDRFLARNGYVMNEADRVRFLPIFVAARTEVHKDLTRRRGTRTSRIRRRSPRTRHRRRSRSISRRRSSSTATRPASRAAPPARPPRGGVRRSGPSAIS